MRHGCLGCLRRLGCLGLGCRRFSCRSMRARGGRSCCLRCRCGIELRLVLSARAGAGGEAAGCRCCAGGKICGKALRAGGGGLRLFSRGGLGTQRRGGRRRRSRGRGGRSERGGRRSRHDRYGSRSRGRDGAVAGVIVRRTIACQLALVICGDRSAANDRLFNHHIGRSADENEMLHIVAAHQQQAAAGINVHGIHDRDARLAVAACVDAVAGELPQKIDHQADQCEDDGQRNDERHRPCDAVSDAESIRDPLVHTNLITLRRTGGRLLAGSGARSPLHSAAEQTSAPPA